MRTRVALLVAAVLLAGVALAGTAAAVSTATDSSTNETSTDAEVGVCVIGVDSPCNGEQWDGDADTDDDGGELTPVENETEGDRITPAKKDTGEGGSAGICLVGAGGPCNGEDASGDQSTEIGEKPPAEPIDDEVNGGPGICLVGADTACNGEEWSSLSDSPIVTGLQTVAAILF